MERLKGESPPEDTVELLDIIGRKIENKIESISDSLCIAKNSFENSHEVSWVDDSGFAEVASQTSILAAPRVRQILQEDSHSLRSLASTHSASRSFQSYDEHTSRSSTYCTLTAITSLPSEARISITGAVGLRYVNA